MKEKRPAKYTSIGGQALLEGIMMRGPERTVAAFCDANGNISTQELHCTFIKDKYPVFRVPLLRGVAAFIDSLRTGMQAINLSADKLVEQEEQPQTPGKLESWMDRHLGKKAMDVLMGVAMVLGLGLGVLLFLALPAWIFNLLNLACGGALSAGGTVLRSVFEGVLRIGVFVGYIALCSLMKDIRRTFEYHGAEHKTIFCYEFGLPLNVENVRRMRRFHPRCGTSFMMIMLVLGIVVGFFIPFSNVLLRTLVKLLLIPLVVGVGYELIRLCGKYDNTLTRIIAAPGLWIQRITTREPDDKMIQTAIMALQQVLPVQTADAPPSEQA